jgi:hypothetical protein
MSQANVLSVAVADEFESPAPDERWIVRVGGVIFKWRRLFLIVGLAITALMGYSATHLRVTAGFTKMIPLHHPFMQTFLHYQGDFGGADKVLIAIKVKQGDIFTKKTLDTVRKITDETFYVKGMERSSLTSMVTPNVRWNEVVEEGFKGGPLMSADGHVVLVGNHGVIAISSDNGHSFVADNVPLRVPQTQAGYTNDGALVYVGYLCAGRKEGKAMPRPGPIGQ